MMKSPTAKTTVKEFKEYIQNNNISDDTEIHVGFSFFKAKTTYGYPISELDYLTENAIGFIYVK